jgi:hypothetical protein
LTFRRDAGARLLRMFDDSVFERDERVLRQ